MTASNWKYANPKKVSAFVGIQASENSVAPLPVANSVTI